MKISYKWLQSYFKDKLPEPEKLSELITFGFAEIESLDKLGTGSEEDTILDVKVLPDRACYALSHRSVAYEVSAITGLPRQKFEWPQPKIAKVRSLDVKIENPELCPRYTARVIENVTAKDLPWVKEHLEAMGQRTINPVVDGANIVMFDMGQPLHAFDADKVEGGIVVRLAKKGEKITTLDNREVALDEGVLIIADSKSPLAIAGIKGGKKVEVTSATKNLILESANFDASQIRKTADRIGIKTDASKRFENRISPEQALVGINDFTAYLFEMDREIKVGEVVDVYPEKAKVVKLQVGKADINGKLGVEISEKEIEKIFARLEFEFEKKAGDWLITIPVFRLDLTIPEDIAEEVGRLFGYDKIPAVLRPKSKDALEIPKRFYYEWKIREILVEAGFSEVMTSSFAEKGSVAILKPLAEDKAFARPELRGGFEKALKVNALNAQLFGSDEIRIFEIGRVFAKDDEKTALAIGYSGPKKKVAMEISSAVKLVCDKLGVTLLGETKDGIFECTLEIVFAKLAEPKNWDIKISAGKVKKYEVFSLYPFIVRDVALFVGAGDSEEKVLSVIGDTAKKSAGELLVKGPWCFDEFEKDGKKSFAFRMIFQSFEKTLTDVDANGFMEKIYLAVSNQGWTVR